MLAKLSMSSSSIPSDSSSSCRRLRGPLARLRTLSSGSTVDMSSLALMAAAELDTKWFPMLLNASILAVGLRQRRPPRLIEEGRQTCCGRGEAVGVLAKARALWLLLIKVAVHSPSQPGRYPGRCLSVVKSLEGIFCRSATSSPAPAKVQQVYRVLSRFARVHITR
jgi:hypothetical protein